MGAATTATGRISELFGKLRVKKDGPSEAKPITAPTGKRHVVRIGDQTLEHFAGKIGVVTLIPPDVQDALEAKLTDLRKASEAKVAAATAALEKVRLEAQAKAQAAIDDATNEYNKAAQAAMLAAATGGKL